MGTATETQSSTREDPRGALVAESRVGKRPLPLPSGVEIKVDGRKVSVKGPKGQLEREFPATIAIELKDKVLTVRMKEDTRTAKQDQGLTRALLGGMVEGTSKGFNTSLDLVGVGYRAELKGRELTLSLGLSHQVKYALPTGLNAKVEILDEGGTKRPRLHLDSADKELLGQSAARIRSFRPPEPYKGKGIRYLGEKIRMKAGKAGAKGSK
jgi:large subunit ribosomal protein L6